MKKFYTYIHKRKDNNQIFYVGVGTVRPQKGWGKYSRAGTTNRRNEIWKRISKKAGGFTWEIVFESESQFEVKQKEIELIKLYGRLDIKNGILSNMTDGGDGRMNGTYESYEGNRKNLDLYREDRKKKCYQYDLDGNFIREWHSITEASKFLGVESTSGIIGCCKSKYNFFKGFIWRYEYFEKLDVNFKVNRYNKIYQYSINGEFIKEWNNRIDIYDFYDYERRNQNLLRALNNINLTVYGFRWSFEKMIKLPKIIRKINISKKVYQYDENYNLIGEYNSPLEASIKNNSSKRLIFYSIKNKSKTRNNHYWLFEKI